MLGNTSGVEWVYLPSDDDAISDAISPPDGITMFGTSYMNLYVRILNVYLCTCMCMCLEVSIAEVHMYKILAIYVVIGEWE